MLEVLLAEESGGGGTGARGGGGEVLAREGGEDEGDFKGYQEEVEEGGSGQELNGSLSG